VEHNIWVETIGPPRTLFRIQDFEVRETFPAPQMPEARRIAPDPEGGIWLGLIRGDLARYKNRKLEIYPFRHSAVPGLDTEVNQLLVTSEGAVLGATNFGMIAWRNGTQQTLTVQNGLPCDGVHALVFDNQGNLWLYLQCGLVEVPKTEMQKWWQKPDAVVHSRLLGSVDGVRPGQAPFAAGARSPDGRLWFANTYALQVVDPDHLSGNSTPPPVHIEEIIADRRSYTPGSNLSLPSFTRDLEIDYTALSFMAPQKVRFRYKLEDHDTEWQEPGSRRQAFYSDLRPGKYRFRVIACNNDGVWNEEGATLDFSVAPAWYQTIWFRVSCVGGFVLLLWALYQLRLQQLERQFGMQVEARVNERTRIARDLHDTLLQSFQGLLMRFQAVSNELAEGELKQELDEAIDRATRAITEGRDAVQGLRSSVVERNDLAAALGTLGKELAAPASQPPEFTMQVEGAARDLHPILRDEVYRVAGEALRNAFRHADARRIEVEIRYDERVFRLRVRDDGKGIGPNFLAEGGRAGHFGLRGMRERAKRVGGKLTVWSELGSGTEVELRVPASHAYTRFRPPHRSWLAEKFFAKDHEMKS
jgi:signal transduction histidine kinase